MAALIDGLAGGSGDSFEDEGVAGGDYIDSEVAVLLEPHNMRSSDGRHGDGEAGYGLAFLPGDEEDFFEKVVRAVRVDEGHDEVLGCFGGGISSGDSWALAGMIGFPEDELRFGEILGLDDGPFILLDHGSERFGHAAQAGLGG